MRKLQILFTMLSVLFLAAPAFAQDAGGGNGMAIGLTSIAAGIGMGLAAGLCGLGQGRATASATEALARNPGARPGILLLLTLGLAFIESLSLFTLVIIFVKVQSHVGLAVSNQAPGSSAGGFCFLVKGSGQDAGRVGAHE